MRKKLYLLGACCAGVAAYLFVNGSSVENPVTSRSASIDLQAKAVLGSPLKPSVPGLSITPEDAPAKDAALPVIMSGSKVATGSSRFPRGLGAAAEEALQKGDAKDSFELANYLRQCANVDVTLSAARDLLQETQDASRREQYVARVDSLTSVQRSCQSIAGDVRELRQRLLEIAAKGGVVGAAAEYFVLASGGGHPVVNSEIVGQLRNDVDAGDLYSLGVIAGTAARLSAVSVNERLVYVNALSLLAGDKDSSIRAGAQSGYRGALLYAISEGLLAGDYLPASRRDADLLSDEYKNKIMNGPLRLQDPTGNTRVSEIVAAVKRAKPG